MTLAYENDNSKLVEVVTVDAEKRIDNSWVQIWKLKFGHRVKLFETLSTRFGQDFEVEVQVRF